jgi:hypothetical protein
MLDTGLFSAAMVLQTALRLFLLSKGFFVGATSLVLQQTLLTILQCFTYAA